MDALWLFLGCAGGALVVAVADAERRKRVQARGVEASLKRFWALFDPQITIRLARGDDAEITRGLDGVDARTIEQHFVRLGDVIIELPSYRGAYRLFRDRNQELLGFLSVSAGGITFSVDSYTVDEEFVTAKTAKTEQPHAGFSMPPSSHRAYVPSTTPLHELVAKHRELIASHAKKSLIRVPTIEDAMRQMELSWSRIRAWRFAQDPDKLLANDLRAFLDDQQYRRFGDRCFRRLKKQRAQLPMARLSDRER